MAKRFFILDAMALIYRAYFSMIRTPLINKHGFNTSAIYGFVNSLNKILEEEKPDYISVAFDTDAPTFRHKIYSDYKGTRLAMPDDLTPQIPKIKEIITGYNIPLIELDGYEADDIIGTLVKMAEKENLCSYIVTPDKDFTQLVNKNILIYKPARSVLGNKISDVEILDSVKVKERYGVGPDKVLDVLALIGDKVDNVPGVRGIGEKTASSLISEFGSLDELYANIDKLTKPKLKENLLTNKSDAYLSKELITIHCSVPIKIEISDLKIGEKNKEKLEKIYSELDFKSHLKKLSQESGQTEQITLNEKSELEELFIPEKFKEPDTIKTVPHDYRIIKNINELKVLINEINKYEEISFDTETTSEDAFKAELVGMSFSYNEFEGFYVPILFKENHTTDLFGKVVPSDDITEENPSIFLEEAIEHVKPILEDKKIRKIGHNIKYDALVMRKYGVVIDNIGFDTMVAAYVLKPESNYKMDLLSEAYINYKPIPITELIGEKAKLTMDQVPYKQAAEYAIEDADVTNRLYHKLEYELKKINLLNLCNEIEFPLIEVLTEIEFNGVKVDVEFLENMNEDLKKIEAGLENDIYEISGLNFNLNSPKQLQEVLFEKLKLNPGRKTKTGFSTDINVLEDLKNQHPIVVKLLDYRVINKLRTTYTEGLLKLINNNTGKVHTSFNQCVAATGRLSSTNPNLQNIPIRTEIGRKLRKAFIPTNKNDVILSADYSQIELRLMAHLSNDENMLKAFDKKRDIHTETASKIFNVKADKVDNNMRRKAKEVNFGIIYGIQAFGLSSRLDIEQNEARDIINTYFTEYPYISSWLEQTKSFARQNGYTETMTGRRRYLSNINNKNAVVRQRDERVAINMPVQGTAADMIKIAMINIHKELKKKKMLSKMILQVHDELVFECPKDEQQELEKIVKSKMKNTLKLNVPIEVEIKTGDNWFGAHS